ncbi:EFR1 family ferrodoxin [uncultured Methanobrevibacter sp.]|uniref:EFR1 family ferrodoxin n=1 Tax=uncultured Methanobrevibacter sp. TaxID=253161 RepID=UPI002601F42A|nr:EFR1 family ferrodoxin [uncultured Methanobrevibacter sp.]
MKILYFTSTGNNLYIAKKLGGELLSIPQLIKNNRFDIEDESIGIIFPVFYANAPKIVREFIEKARFKTDYLFLIASYGSDGDQNAFKILKKAFNKKGMKVNYTNSVLMVDNYLPMFDMKEEKEIKDDSDIDSQIEIIRNDIESRKEFHLNKKSFTDVPFIEKVLESTMTKRFHIIVGDGCSDCKVCSRICPKGNIDLSGEKPVIGDDCLFCLGCVHHCKENVFTINNEKNNKERFSNPHIKVSEIIKSNNML